MLICSAHGTVIDREHRECHAETVGGCIMSGRGGYPFSDFELSSNRVRQLSTDSR
jgi:hypothetical protein